MKLLEQLIDELETLKKTNRYLTEENERLKDIEKKYNQLLDSSIKHSEIMMTNLLKEILKHKEAKA